VQDVATALSGLLENFNNLSPEAQDAIVKLGGFLLILGPLTKGIGGLNTGFQFLKNLPWPAIGAVLSGIWSAVTGTGAAAGAVGTGFVAFVAAVGPVLLMLAAIAVGLYAIYYVFKNNVFGITTTVKQLGFIIKWTFDLVVKTIGEAAQAIYGYFSGIIEDGDYLNDWLTHFPQFLRGPMEQIGRLFAQLRDNIIEAFQRVDWAQVGKMILLGLANGLLLGIPAMVAAAIRAAQALKNSFDNELDMHSPSGEFIRRGILSGQSYAIGLESSRSQIVAVSRSLAGSAQAAFAQYLKANGFSGNSQFAAPTARNMRAAFSNYLRAGGFSGRSQFALPTSGNMQAAFAQFAQAQAAIKPSRDPFMEKGRPTRVEQVNYFSTGLTVRQAQDIYSEKFDETMRFLEKRLGGG
jgi:hypothetical protein